jgi:lipopolysaccharide transport system permease protein
MAASATATPPALRHSSAAFGSFFWLLVRRDLKIRYAGSTLGALWNLIHPLMLIAIYMTIFSSLMPSRGPVAQGLHDYGALNYGVHLCAGLIPWLLFSDILMRSTGLLIEIGNFLQKVSFPPLVLFWSLFFNAFLIQGIGFIAFIGVLLALGYTVPPLAFAGLGIMLLFGITAMGLGLILAGINVFFRDAAQVLNVVMQLLFWFNPIVYDKNLVFSEKALPPGEHLQGLQHIGQNLMALNPFERFITASQSLFGVVSTPPTTLDWWIIALTPLLSLGFGLYFFRRMLPDVRDCL